jgi:chaperonin GroES
MAKVAKKSAQKSITKKNKKTKPKVVAKKASKKVLKKASKKVLKKAAVKAVKKAVAKVTPKVKFKVESKVAAKMKTADYSQVFSPLDDRILVLKAVGGSNRTPGGLYIPDTVSGDDRPSQGKVVAVGPGHRDKKGRLRPLDVKIGDTVMFKTLTGSDVKIDATELLCLRESEIFAIVK